MRLSNVLKNIGIGIKTMRESMERIKLGKGRLRRGERISDYKIV